MKGGGQRRPPTQQKLGIGKETLWQKTICKANVLISLAPSHLLYCLTLLIKEFPYCAGFLVIVFYELHGLTVVNPRLL